MTYETNYLVHHGIKGMKWGVRRYQNEDGSYTEEGRRRNYKLLKKGSLDGEKRKDRKLREMIRNAKNDEELKGISNAKHIAELNLYDYHYKMNGKERGVIGKALRSSNRDSMVKGLADLTKEQYDRAYVIADKFLGKYGNKKLRNDKNTYGIDIESDAITYADRFVNRLLYNYA